MRYRVFAQAAGQGAALIIPEYDSVDPKPYPGGIQPGYYSAYQLVAMLRDHAADPEAIRFIADMLEV